MLISSIDLVSMFYIEELFFPLMQLAPDSSLSSYGYQLTLNQVTELVNACKSVWFLQNRSIQVILKFTEKQLLY